MELNEANDYLFFPAPRLLIGSFNCFDGYSSGVDLAEPMIPSESGLLAGQRSRNASFSF